MEAPKVAVVAAFPQRLDYHQISRLLPYKSPWLLIDRVISWGPGEIVVQKAISSSEVNMAAHLDTGPSIMPGVLQIEFVNQAVMLLMILLNSTGQRQDGIEGGAGVMAQCKGRFHSPAFIGDVITATVRIVDVVANKTIYQGDITSGDRKVATVDAIGAHIAVPMVSA